MRFAYLGWLSRPPLRGLLTRQKGGFYHDGRFPTLDAVLNHYDSHSKLKLTAEQKRQLVNI
jgi:cytochrome c peroxidase